MTLKPPRVSAVLALLLVGALVAGCAGPDESVTGPDASGDEAVEDGADPAEPTLPAFDPDAGSEGDAARP